MNTIDVNGKVAETLSTPRILLVDDERLVCADLEAFLEDEGYRCESIHGSAKLEAECLEYQPDVILLDLKLPDGHGLDLLPVIRNVRPTAEVIILTGYGTIESAVEATKRGAYQFICKPLDMNALRLHIQRALEYKRLKNETHSLRGALSSLGGEESPVFKSASMKKVLETVERVARTDVSVMITGESGTGKEVICDLIHALSPRSAGPLIKVNCAALPRELIESELFGSVKGAFTGAHYNRTGLFRQAEKGTLMLDEISEMPIDTQSKLLRVLQEKMIRPVGGQQNYPTDCRLITATNRNSEEAIREGKLREDLFYRINAIEIEIPPLRERPEEIIPLAVMFLKRFAAQAGRNLVGFTADAAKALQDFDWPGNVRQLQNEIQRAVLMCPGKEITRGDLSIETSPRTKDAESDSNLMEGIERNAIEAMLKETGGNKLETAKRLGIGRQTLYNKLKKFNLS